MTGEVRERGFTLVELMVVMTIIALTCALAAVALPTSGQSVRGEAERLGARIQAAQQQAVLQNQRLALQLDAHGYRFEARRDGRWQEVAMPPLAAERWKKGTSASFPSGGTRIRFDPTGLSDPLVVELRREDARAIVRSDGQGKIDVAR